MQTKPTVINSLTDKTHAVIEDGELLAVISLPKMDDDWRVKVICALMEDDYYQMQRKQDEKNLPALLKSANTYDVNGNVEIQKYGERYWAVTLGGELLAVVLYRKGAEAIKGLIEVMRGN